jgi:hypothetical protein
MKNKDKDKKIDPNLFKAQSYELAGEIGILDNEEMKRNDKLQKDSKSKK